MKKNSSQIQKGDHDYLRVGARGGSMAFVLKVLSVLLLLLNQIALARILGPDGIGEVILTLNIVFISSQLAKFGMEDAMMRFIPVYIEQRNYSMLRGTIYFAFKSSFFLSLFLTLLIIALSDFIAMQVFHSEELIKLIPVTAIAVLFHAMRGVMGGILKGYKETFRAVLPEYFISPFLRLCIFILLSTQGVAPLFAVYAFIAGEFFAVLLSAVFLLKKVQLLRSHERSCDQRKIIDVGVTMLMTGGVSIFLFTQADVWIVGMYTPSETVGIYGVVTKLVMLIILPLMTFSTIIPPLMASMYTSHDIDKLRILVRESSRWIMSIAMPIIIILILEGEFILNVVFGKKFMNGYPALVILATGQLINSASGLVGYLLQMTGGHRAIMKINLFWGILNVVINLLLVPRFGIIGAAFSTAFCMAMANITAVFLVYRRMSVLTVAKGLWFDAMFIVLIGSIYGFLQYYGILYGKHITVVAALSVYLWKSLSRHDLPWRFLSDNLKTM